MNNRSKAFADAVVKGDIEAVKKFLASDLDKTKPFIIAAREGHVEIIKLFLENGVDINSQNAKGDTALHLAAFNKRTEVVAELLKSDKINVDVINGLGYTALSCAIVGKHAEMVQMLLDKKADPDLFGYQAKYSPAIAAHLMAIEYGDNAECRKIAEKFPTSFKPHAKMVDLWFQLGYADVADRVERMILGFGLCHGFSIIGAMICKDIKGIKRFNEVLNLVNEYTTEELEDNIRQANKIRGLAIEKYKEQINENDIATDRLKLSQSDYRIIIGNVLDSEFDDLSNNEKESLIKFFYNKIIYNKIDDLTPSVSCLINKIDNAINQFLPTRRRDEFISTYFKNSKMPDGELFLDLESYLENAGMMNDLRKQAHLVEEEFQFTDDMHQSLSLGLYLINPTHENEKNLVVSKTGVFTGCYSIQDLEYLFGLWQQEDITRPITFFLGGGEHSSFIKYLPNEKTWINFDINRGKAIYLTDLNQLARVVLASHKKDSVINLQLVSSVEDSEVLETCIAKVKKNEKWKTIDTVNPDNAQKIFEMANNYGDINTAETALEKSRSNFFTRNWKSIAVASITGLLAFGSIAAIVAASVLSVGIVPILGFVGLGLVSAILSPVIVVKAIKHDAMVLNHPKKEAAVRSTIFERYKNSQSKMLDALSTKERSVEQLLPKGRTAYKERCELLNTDLRKILKPYATAHSIKMQCELNKPGRHSPEIVLSRTIAQAFNAKYYQTLSSYFFREPRANKLYDPIINWIDIDETIKKIGERIKTLNGKVHGINAGNPIIIDGEEIVVSKQVANLYGLLTNIKNKENKLKALAEILDFAKEESSRSFEQSFIRHDAVWQFFGQVNEMLIVKNDAQIISPSRVLNDNKFKELVSESMESNEQLIRPKNNASVNRKR